MNNKFKEFQTSLKNNTNTRMVVIKELKKETNIPDISLTKYIAEQIVDKDYDYSLEENIIIPDTAFHKNTSIKISKNIKTYPLSNLKNFFC